MKLGTKEICVLELDGNTVRYEVTVKNVKRINLRVINDGSVKISVSPRVSLQEIERFVKQNAEFILKALDRVKQREKALPFCVKDVESYRAIPILGVNRTLRIEKGTRNQASVKGEYIDVTLVDPSDRDLLKETVRKMLGVYSEALLPKICEKMLPLFSEINLKMPSLQFRCMTSRWGSCCPSKNTVTLNKFLICVPIECIEGVVIHELAHYIHTDHSPDFHRLMNRLVFDLKQREATLHLYGGLLHSL